MRGGEELGKVLLKRSVEIVFDHPERLDVRELVNLEVTISNSRLSFQVKG